MTSSDFFKNNLSGRYWAKKGKKLAKKSTFRFFSTKSYFLPIFENMHVLGCFVKAGKYDGLIFTVEILTCCGHKTRVRRKREVWKLCAKAGYSCLKREGWNVLLYRYFRDDACVLQDIFAFLQDEICLSYIQRAISRFLACIY